MEQSNVNNLNGIPNFGHGELQEVTPEVVQEEPKVEVVQATEEVEIINQENQE